MNAKLRFRRSRGYVSYVMVLSIGAVLTMLMVYTYRDASQSMVVSSGIQQRADYLNKEDASLRALLSIVPNRAIRVMQDGSSSVANSPSLTWSSIFQDALIQANADTAISAQVAATANLNTTYSGNTGDAAINNVGVVFQAIPPGAGSVNSGCDNTLGVHFPPPLNVTNANVVTLDETYPIISSSKYYGPYAAGRVGVSVTDYPQYNLIPYPQIDFGYAAQGSNFVAKRNWWAFKVNLYANTAAQTNQIDQSRNYVLSLYEIPSQLAISADAFTTLGRHSSGTDWGSEVTVEGQVFAGQADVQGASKLEGLASRRGMTLSTSSKIGDQSFSGNPFDMGLREKYQIETGAFYPVSMSSETGRAAFVPINRGIEFYDRFADGVWGGPSAVLSPTNWDDYSVGAQQCAMKLDVTGVISATDQTPTFIQFSYKRAGVEVQDPPMAVDPTGWATATPRVPFDVVVLSGSRPCVVFKPEYLKDYLISKGADDLSVNNSIAVNANYRTGSVDVRKPSFPCLNDDVALILTECTDLTAFTKGFSLVTNLRLYIADDFNIKATTPPTGITGTFYPPTSLFAPERRFGSADEPWRVEHEGSVGSLAGNYQSGTSGSVNLLDLKTGGGNSLAANSMTVNLKPVTHPGALPPINAMNWLIVLEEKR